jgi:hypothetical protein
MHIVANFWPGATLEQYSAEKAHLEGKSRPESQLMLSVAEVDGGLLFVSIWKTEADYESWVETTLMPQIDLPGGMEGRPVQHKGRVVEHYSALKTD